MSVLGFELNKLIAQKEKQLPAATNAYRISDGHPWTDVFVDALADRLLVSTRLDELPEPLMKELAAMGRPVFLKSLDKDVKKAPVQIFGEALPLRFEILENGVSYLMDMESGYSQGIFLDQRDNRRKLRARCSRGMKVLNTFAYTGAFSVCAALAGAQTTTLDLARPCLDWCKENMLLNGIDPADHYFCKGDTMHWLERFAAQGREFDAIILDPPTFSRDDKGRVWRVERDFYSLVEKAIACLSPRGFLICTSNCRKLSHDDFYQLVSFGAAGYKVTAEPMPFDFDGEDYLKCIWVDPRA